MGSGGSSEDGSSERRQRAHEGHVLAEQEVDYDELAWGSNPVPTPIIQHIDAAIGATTLAVHVPQAQPA